MPRKYDFSYAFSNHGTACMSIRISCKQKVSHQCVIFQSAWPPTREAALFAGKGFLSSMLQHVFQMDVYDVSSTDSKNRNDSDGKLLPNYKAFLQSGFACGF